MRINLDRGHTRWIIDACRQEGLSREQCAYVLATAWHETGGTMKPIKEWGGKQYLRKKRYWPYYGRGYVQLTWRQNYALAARKLGAPLVQHPDLALQPRYAVPILVRGMKDGWFTGKKLEDYINEKRVDYIRARRIVNGMDRARRIARYARQFDRLLKEAGYAGHPIKRDKKPVGLAAAWAAFISALIGLLVAFWKEIVGWLFG